MFWLNRVFPPSCPFKNLGKLNFIITYQYIAS
nr:MAG TPA: hypothetical protein [Caudoviricetes sp.]